MLLNMLRKLGGLRGTPVAPCREAGRRRPLLAEAEHAASGPGADEEGRHRAAFHLLLEINPAARVAPCRNRQMACHDMTAAGGALALGEPAGLCRGRVHDGSRML